MPNWKKLVVSGSDASLNSLTTPDNIVNQLTASYAINASTTAINSGTVIHITTPSTTWDLVHNVNEAYPIVTIWNDATNRIIQPDEIESIDINTIRVTFAAPVSGYANISRAGHVLSGSLLWTSLIGPADITASINLSGSITADNGFTGSLFGTASYAVTASYFSGSVANSISASYALTSSYLKEPTVSGSIGPVDSIYFTTSSGITVDAAEIAWNPAESTFDMGLLNGVTLQVGQEIHFYGKASGSISNGDAVMFAGSQGDHLLMSKASQSTINQYPQYFIGVATQDFNNNDFGYITVLGKVRGLNTLAYTQGAVLYFDSEGITSGALTQTKPNAPYAKIEVAAVVRVHNTQGILMVRPHTMPKLEDIQDVNTINATYGDILTKSGSVWINSKTLSGSYVLTGSLEATSFTGSLLGTASYAATASVLINPTSYRTSISGSLSYTINHNLGEKYVIVQAYDSNNHQVIPNDITLIDTSSLSIGFPVIFIGNVVIVK
jgi:hypothetical protein